MLNECSLQLYYIIQTLLEIVHNVATATRYILAATDSDPLDKVLTIWFGNKCFDSIKSSFAHLAVKKHCFVQETKDHHSL